MDRTSNGESSMYLSFDSESTMNSLAYKTTNDMSAVSVSNMEVENSQDSHMNSTLEAQRDEPDCEASFMKTAKKAETLMPPAAMCAAGVFPKNILKEYNVLCSTPTKEQLMRTVQISRGSEGETCIDLGLSFREMEDEKKSIQLQVMPTVEENKENTTHVESEEALTLSSGSSSSSVECVVTSVIYQKTTTALSTTEEESLEELMECVQTTEAAGDGDDKPKASVDDYTQKASGDDESAPQVLDDAEATPKVNNAVESNREEKIKKAVELSKATFSSTANKPKRSIPVPKNIRRSMCEPDLQANRPSRIIFNGIKCSQYSKTNAENKDIASDIPKLLDTMLKITNAAEKEVETTNGKVCESGIDKLTGTAHKERVSMMPPQAQTGDKRTYNFAQRRMSVVVKTTLNSPARKIARKSTLPNGPQTRRSVMPQPVLTRRSVMPQPVLTRRSVMPQPALARRSVMPQPALARRSVMPPAAVHSANKNDALAVGRSMLPMGQTKTTTLTTTRTTVATTMCTNDVLTAASSNENTTNTKTMRTYIYPQEKQLPKKQGGEQKSLATNKPKTSEMSFVCNVCACKFRIKSLLDAHKRSHEDDMPAAFIKKPSTRAPAAAASAMSAPSSNQCKYCDKKFALVRALHIHLMQNCTKIPPGDKRKLQFTEMNHVEKAQLPEIFHHAHHSGANSHSSSLSNSQTSSSSNLNVVNATSQLAYKSHSNLSSAPMSSTESLVETKEITMIASKIVTGVNTEMCTSTSSTQMAPPTANKIKVKKTAHAGVYRTPNKNIVCHTCKKSFKTIIEHINHNMMEHSKTTPVSGDSSNEQIETSANSST